MAPSLETLTARFLARQSVSPESVAMSEVEPHEVLTGFRAGAASTWRDATAVLGLFGESTPVSLPPEWGAFVSSLRDVSMLPVCVGAVPQRVREISAKPSADSSISTGQLPQLRKWIAVRQTTGTPLDLIVAGGMLRAMGEFAKAADCLDAAKPTTLAQQNLLANERAALLWHQGEFAKALAIWSTMDDSPAVIFNRAVCHWRMGEFAKAESAFTTATNSLPDSSGWAHLAGMAMLMCG